MLIEFEGKAIYRNLLLFAATFFSLSSSFAGVSSTEFLIKGFVVKLGDKDLSIKIGIKTVVVPKIYADMTGKMSIGQIIEACVPEDLVKKQP
jgi:hypothetical protein